MLYPLLVIDRRQVVVLWLYLHNVGQRLNSDRNITHDAKTCPVAKNRAGLEFPAGGNVSRFRQIFDSRRRLPVIIPGSPVHRLIEGNLLCL